MDHNNKLSERILEELTHLRAEAAEIKITLARNTTSLEYHIKRTDNLEKKLEPVEQHVDQVRGAFKFIGLLSLVVGIAAAAARLVN